VALQLYHSRAARQGRRPRAWAVTLAVQAVLVYAFAFPFIWASVGALGPFLAGSVLLLVPGRRWRWAGYAAVVVSYSLLDVILPVRAGDATGHHQGLIMLVMAAETAAVGLMVYGMSRLAELEGLRGRLARMAAVTERLRIARDVHDLLGLGLSAIALMADLIGALTGRDDAQAAAEMRALTRICAAARADTRLTAAGGQRLSLTCELAAARQILASARAEGWPT
jgi:two-component system, NarL family, sensor histidine kinase DesK